MSRPRGPDYAKHLAKRMRMVAVDKPRKEPVCFSCQGPLFDHQTSVGDKILCDWCDDKLTRKGFLQIASNRRLYPDGSIKNVSWQIHDIVTGRLEWPIRF